MTESFLSMKSGSNIWKFLKAYYKIYKNSLGLKEVIALVASILILLISVSASVFLYGFLNNLSWFPFFNPNDLPSIPTYLLNSLLFSLFTALYFVFIFMPITGFVQKGEDPEFLLKFPITYLEAFSIETIRTLISIWKIALFIPPAITLFLHISNNLVIFILSVISYGMFLLHLSGLGYIVLSFLQGMLQDRKFRDIAGLIAGLGGFFLYFSFYILPRIAPVEEILRITYTWHLLLPSGWIIELVNTNNPIWIIPIAIIFILTMYLGSKSFKYSYYLSTEGRRSEKKVRSVNISIPVGKSMNTIISKDIKYVLRDPVIKKSFISLLIFPIIFGFQAVGEPSFGGSTYLAFMLGIFFSLLFANYLGYERDGIFKLLNSPINRKSIILAKNLLITLLALIYFSAVFTVFNLIFELPILKPLLTSLSVFLISITVANNTTIYYPQKIPDSGLSSGNKQGFFTTIIFGIITLILSTPIILHILGGTFIIPETPFIIIPIYVIIIYTLGIRWTTKKLLQKETKILEKFN